MTSNHPARRWAQGFCIAVLLVSCIAIAASSALGRRILGGGGQKLGPSLPGPTALAAGLVDPTSMPAYHDARDKLQRLDDARIRLLGLFSDMDIQAFPDAAADYATATAEFQDSLGRLRDHVEPHTYGCLAWRLITERIANPNRFRAALLPELPEMDPERETPQ